MELTFIYYILTALSAAGAFLCFKSPSKVKSYIILAVLSLSLCAVSSLRYNVGFDYMTYAEQYAAVGSCTAAEYFSRYRTEIGFYAFMRICSFISLDSRFFFFAVSLAVSLLLFFAVSKNVPYGFWGFSVYFFITLGFFFGTMNLIRQYLAALIALFAIKYIEKRRFTPFIATVLTASLFHKSALILIPIYFLAQIPLTKKPLIIYGAATVFAYLFSEPVLKLVTKYVYGYYDVDSSVFMQPGANIYVIVPLIIFLSAFLMRKNLSAPLLNYSFFAFIFYIMMTRHFILERLAVYFSASYIFLLPKIIEIMYGRMKNAEAAFADAKIQLKSQKAGKARQQKNAAKSSESLKDAKNFFIASAVFLMCLGFAYQILAQNLNFHGVFPYTMIF